MRFPLQLIGVMETTTPRVYPRKVILPCTKGLSDDESAISLSDNDPSGGSVSSSQASLSSAISNFDVSCLPDDSIEDDNSNADSDKSFDGYEFYDEKTFPSGVAFCLQQDFAMGPKR
jgi:hypothetical protein